MRAVDVDLAEPGVHVALNFSAANLVLLVEALVHLQKENQGCC